MNLPPPRAVHLDPAPPGWIGPALLLLLMALWAAAVGLIAGPVTTDSQQIAAIDPELSWIHPERWGVAYGWRLADGATREGDDWTAQVDTQRLVQTAWGRHRFPLSVLLVAILFSAGALVLAASPWHAAARGADTWWTGDPMRRWCAWTLGLFPWVYGLLGACTGLGYAPLLYRSLSPLGSWLPGWGPLVGGDWVQLALGCLVVGCAMAVAIDRLLNGQWVSLTRLAGVDDETHDPGGLSAGLPSLHG